MTREEIENFHYLDTTLRYNSRTGELFWRQTRVPGCFAGQLAGTVIQKGYIKVVIHYKEFKGHRLAWILYTKKQLGKKDVIDHINGDPSDNRIRNLRLCSQKENSRNSKTPSNNSSGRKGVSLQGSKYRAYICVDRKQIHLGRFEKLEDAHTAYEKAAQKHFGKFANLSP